MSNINQSIGKTVEFTRKWLEGELQRIFDNHKKEYINDKEKYYAEIEKIYFSSDDMSFTLRDVDIIFLAGGTCRIPFFKKFMRKISPYAEIIMDGQLEIITATGAVIHALQVLSGEVEPYIEGIQNQNNEPESSNERPKQSGSSGSDSNVESKIISNQDQANFIQPETTNNEKMEVDIYENKSKSREETGSNAHDHGKKNDNSTDGSNVNERKNEHDQVATPPLSEAGHSERKRRRNTADVESSQVEEPPEKKLLLPESKN